MSGLLLEFIALGALSVIGIRAKTALLQASNLKSQQER